MLIYMTLSSPNFTLLQKLLPHTGRQRWHITEVCVPSDQFRRAFQRDWRSKLRTPLSDAAPWIWGHLLYQPFGS